MFVISQLLSRLGSLQGSGTPESGDTIVRIPNTLLEPAPFPLSIPSNQGVIYTDSFALVGQTTITNTGGGSVTILATLQPGIWILSFLIDSEFNWLNANPIAQDNRLVLTENLVTNIELWSSAARASRTVVEIPGRKFTLRTAVTVRLIQNGNGVGQTSTLQVNVHAERYL